MFEDEELQEFLRRIRNAIYDPAHETSAQAIEAAQAIVDELGYGPAQTFWKAESWKTYYRAEPARSLASSLVVSAAAMAAWAGTTPAMALPVCAVFYWIKGGVMEEELAAILLDPGTVVEDGTATAPPGMRLVPKWVLADLSGLTFGI